MNSSKKTNSDLRPQMLHLRGVDHKTTGLRYDPENAISIFDFDDIPQLSLRKLNHGATMTKMTKRETKQRIAQGNSSARGRSVFQPIVDFPRFLFQKISKWGKGKRMERFDEGSSSSSNRGISPKVLFILLLLTLVVIGLGALWWKMTRKNASPLPINPKVAFVQEYSSNDQVSCDQPLLSTPQSVNESTLPTILPPCSPFVEISSNDPNVVDTVFSPSHCGQKPTPFVYLAGNGSQWQFDPVTNRYNMTRAPDCPVDIQISKSDDPNRQETLFSPSHCDQKPEPHTYFASDGSLWQFDPTTMLYVQSKPPEVRHVQTVSDIIVEKTDVTPSLQPFRYVAGDGSEWEFDPQTGKYYPTGNSINDSQSNADGQIDTRDLSNGGGSSLFPSGQLPNPFPSSPADPIVPIECKGENATVFFNTLDPNNTVATFNSKGEPCPTFMTDGVFVSMVDNSRWYFDEKRLMFKRHVATDTFPGSCISGANT